MQKNVCFSLKFKLLFKLSRSPSIASFPLLLASATAVTAAAAAAASTAAAAATAAGADPDADGGFQPPVLTYALDSTRLAFCHNLLCNLWTFKKDLCCIISTKEQLSAPR